MKQYLNLGRISSVRFHEYGNTYTTFRFKTGKPYTYSYCSAGKTNVECMKRLADSGSVLGSYIIHSCKTLYER